MHTTYARGTDESHRGVIFHDSAPDRGRAPRIRVVQPSPEISRPVATGYGSGPRINWRSAGFVVILHLLLGAVLIQTQVIPPHHVQSALNLLDLNAPPPAPEAPPPPDMVEPEIYVPPPAIELPRTTPPALMVSVQEPPAVPTAPVVVKSVVAAPRPPAPPSLVSDDLGATMISARPPVYPMESRRKREQGTVVLMLTLDTEGRVADIRVERSSGHERLDKAALSAVRQWRWSPTTRDGVLVTVKGLVEIPFVLKG